jgi:hypothetical protein
MRTLAISLAAALTAAVMSPATARAQQECQADPDALPDLPSPIPEDYDWRAYAEAWCGQLATCSLGTPDCVDRFLVDVESEPGEYDPDPGGTDSSATATSQLSCQQSVDYGDGEVACVGCPDPNDCGVTVFCGFDQHGNFCGNCGPGEECIAGVCEFVGCCDGLSCGPDPCNPSFSCGECEFPFECEFGTCTCTSIEFPPSCGLWVDECGETHDAGDCTPPYECENGTCTCTVVWTGDCGLDECGNFHDCPFGETCVGDTCEPDCIPCEFQECGQDSTCGGTEDCGTCSVGEECDGTFCQPIRECSCQNGVCKDDEGFDCDSCDDCSGGDGGS